MITDSLQNTQKEDLLLNKNEILPTGRDGCDENRHFAFPLLTLEPLLCGESRMSIFIQECRFH
jgi:hypothetical protein